MVIAEPLSRGYPPIVGCTIGPWGTVTTSGIYVRLGDRYAFMFGPSNAHTGYGVVRFGGHTQAHETALECALREVTEEADIEVTLSTPAATFYMASADAIPSLVAAAECREVRPLLVSGGSLSAPHSVTFIGRTSRAPRPSMETQGIILLSGDEIRRICESDVELGQLVSAGARIIERSKLDRQQRLVPHLQLKFLNWALQHGVVGE